MKKRIIITNAIITFVALFLTLCSSVLIVNSLNQSNSEREIRSYLNIACNIFDGENFEETANYLYDTNHSIRLTIIDKDGQVMVDNSSETTENHLTRPEITNIGTIYRRYSKTLKLDMIYLAKVDDNFYVRIALPLQQISTIIDNFIIFGVIVFILITSISTLFIYLSSKNMYVNIKTEIGKTSEILNDKNTYFGNDENSITTQISQINVLLKEKLTSLEIYKDKIEFILNHIMQGLIVVNMNGNIDLINEYASNLFGFKSEEIIDKNIIYLCRNEFFQETIQKYLVSEKNDPFDFEINGKIYYIVPTSIKKEWLSNESKYGISLLLVDVTSKREIETLKREFFANASHELKSPLTSIIGYQQMIKEGILTQPDEIKDATMHTIKEAKRMNDLIVEMLDLSRLELKEKKDLTDINIKNIIEDIVSSYSFQIDEKKIDVKMNLSDVTLKINQGDCEKLFSNLISNAIKYNKDNGKIIINLTRKYFSIEDTGIGIESCNFEKIFKRFYRVDKARSKDLGGTGLGLSIVKHVCQNYGFNINVKSNLGEGSTFIIYFNN